MRQSIINFDRLNLHYIFLTIFLSAFICNIPFSYGQFNEYHPEVNWYTIESENFAVHFHQGAERTAKVVLKIAEEIFPSVTALYDYKPEKVHFVIKDIDDYSNGATYFFDNKIEIWASPLDTDLRGTHNWLRNVISHEFTHMVQLQASMKTTRRMPAFYLQWLNYEDERRPDVLYGFPNGIVSYPIPMINVPSWFAEGTAQYMRAQFNYDNWDSHRDMILRCYVLSDSMLSWNQMGVFEKNSLGNESVYNSGFALVRYIAWKYGEDKLKLINEHLRSGWVFTIDSAIEDVLRISGKQLYNEWKDFLKKDYSERIKSVVENLNQGELIETEGFANFYPIYSPDRKKIYYISNKGQDYFITSLYEYNLETKTSKLIQDGVASSFSLTKDGKKIIYSKLDDDNKNWVKVHDLYLYDLTTEKEERLTFGLRANNPSLSNDGKWIVFISQRDGTLNLNLIDIQGKNHKLLTNFKNGEQIFNPKFSFDDSFIVFDYSMNGSRDIAKINLDGNGLEFILNSESVDERNPIIVNNNELIYSADVNGIFNIYKYNLQTKQTYQITNVIGGAFMPAINENGDLVYSGYTTSGYKIFLLKSELTNKDFSNFHYSKSSSDFSFSQNSSDNSEFHWDKLRKFDDTQIPNFEVKNYSGRFTKMSFIPFLRLDNYYKKAKGYELIKPGLYFYSSDMLNRFDIFGSASINSRFERDLYLNVGYRDRIPGLYSLGLKPEITLEGYNVSRTTDQVLGWNPDTTETAVNYEFQIPIEVSYNLLEFDITAKHPFITKEHNLEFKFVFSRYESILGSFIIPNTAVLYPTTRDVYLIGRLLGFRYYFENYARNVNQDINPIGTKIDFKAEYEFNKFNPQGDFEVKDGILVPLFQNVRFTRLELNLFQSFQLPWWKHALAIKLRGGTLLGPQVDDFFDFYLGGLIGMKSYPFYSISGNEIAHLNLSYIFPIAQNIDARLGHIYIDKIFGMVYGDFGNAWNGKEVKLKNFKKGVGAELRVQMNSFYIFPTSMFFNVSYSFDKFQRVNAFTKELIEYGKEVKFYFGILFGFDF